MRSSDTATSIVLRSENGWMAEQIDPRAFEYLLLARPGPKGRRQILAGSLSVSVPAVLVPVQSR
jgi:hypothetical protein